MELHQAQKEVAKDNHDFRVVNCGRQFGKTTLAILEMIACAYAKGGREVAYFATTHDQARNIAWTMLKEATQSIWAKKPNETLLELYVTAQDGKTSRITLRGFENVETARGQQFDLLVIDEVAQMKDWVYSWDAILAPTLIFRKGKALFISTPLGYNHFYDLYQKGQKESPYYKSWTFTSYDNPFLPREKIEQEKENATEDWFAQEYLADFRRHTGLVYKEFTDQHIKELPGFVPHYFIRGCDRGYVNPSAVPIIAVDKEGLWYQIDEIYEPQLTNPVLYEKLKEISQKHGIKSYELSTMDSAQIGDILELAEMGADFIPVSKVSGEKDKNYVLYKVQKFAERLKIKKGKPGYYVHPRCVNTIEEFKHYEWKKVKEEQKDEPLKMNDHMMDALGDLNAMYLHQFPAKKDPYADKIPGTYIEPALVPDDQNDWTSEPNDRIIDL